MNDNKFLSGKEPNGKHVMAYPFLKPGTKFSKLTVIEYIALDRYRQRLYRVECICGNRIIIPGKCLKSGNSKQCKGCQGRIGVLRINVKKYGEAYLDQIPKRDKRIKELAKTISHSQIAHCKIKLSRSRIGQIVNSLK